MDDQIPARLTIYIDERKFNKSKVTLDALVLTERGGTKCNTPMIGFTSVKEPDRRYGTLDLTWEGLDSLIEALGRIKELKGDLV